MQLPQSVQQLKDVTPTQTECNAKPYAFGQLGRRQIVADFSGGQITSDGGLILMAQLSSSRRVVCKLTYDALGARRHVVVTSFATVAVGRNRH